MFLIVTCKWKWSGAGKHESRSLLVSELTRRIVVDVRIVYDRSIFKYRNSTMDDSLFVVWDRRMS